MSGIFKSFDRLLSQSRLAQSGHKLLLRSTNAVLHPTAYYYQPLRSVSQRLSHPQDIFELGLASSALTRQANSYSELLNGTEKESLQAEINARISVNAEEIQANLSDINAYLNQGRTEFPVQSVADIAYTLAFAPSVPQSLQVNQIVTKFLLPVLQSKLSYASVHNIQDILNSLVKLQLVDSNKELVKNLLNTLVQKDLPSQLEPVVVHGWTNDQYEEVDSSSSCATPWNIQYCRASNFANYIQAGGNSSTFARVRFSIQELADNVVYRFLNPFLFREHRINKRFEARNEEADAQVFSATLSAIVTALPETAQVANTLKSRL